MRSHHQPRTQSAPTPHESWASRIWSARPLNTALVITFDLTLGLTLIHAPILVLATTQTPILSFTISPTLATPQRSTQCCMVLQHCAALCSTLQHCAGRKAGRQGGRKYYMKDCMNDNMKDPFKGYEGLYEGRTT